jgi:hypothetical protein
VGENIDIGIKKTANILLFLVSILIDLQTEISNQLYYQVLLDTAE